MSASPLRRSVVVTNPQGLHARPADRLVRTAGAYQSRIVYVCRGERIDGKSILSLLTLGAAQGTELSVEIDGDDAPAAMAAITELFESGFDENEPSTIGDDERQSTPTPPRGT